jgi:hypothetical protein
MAERVTAGNLNAVRDEGLRIDVGWVRSIETAEVTKVYRLKRKG